MNDRKPPEPGTEPRRTAPIGPSEILRLARQYAAKGRLREADGLFQRVLSAYPRDAEALHGRGMIAARVGRFEEAVTLLRKAIASQHDFVPARLDLARVLQATGRLDEAVAVAERAVRAAPASAHAHMVLGELLGERGAPADALAAHIRATELDPESAESHFRLGLTYQQLERLEDAATALNEAIEHAPERADLHYSLGTVHHGLRNLDAALVAYERALSLRPDLAENLFALGKPRHIHALLERKDLTGALRNLDLFLARQPGQSCALALKAIVLDELGEREQVRHLVDFHGLIKKIQLNDTELQGSVPELNDALVRHIEHHPTLRSASAEFSLFRGKTTGELLKPPFGPIRAFEQMVRRAVESFIAALPAQSSHPFVASRPSEWSLTMWANVIESEGFQVPHIHPSGWLSAVYYVKVPEVVRSEGQSGWIEFGEPYQDIAHNVRPETLALRPEDGLLLLFPSYFYHRTLPFQSNERRISIAFDVVPKRRGMAA
jgi:tetratricopeptide (TPR) repeat protein